jgi:hypothetical protein
MDEFEDDSRAVAREFRLRAIELRTEAERDTGERRNSKMALAQEYERRAEILDPDSDSAAHIAAGEPGAP